MMVRTSILLTSIAVGGLLAFAADEENVVGAFWIPVAFGAAVAIASPALRRSVAATLAIRAAITFSSVLLGAGLASTPAITTRLGDPAAIFASTVFSGLIFALLIPLHRTRRN